MPELDDLELYGEPVNDRLDHRGGLSDHQHAPSIEAVGDRAAQRAYEQARQGVEESDDADRDRRFGYVPDQPALRDVLHEVARAGDQRAFHQETKISMPERTERAK